jgi:hypothetical protein
MIGVGARPCVDRSECAPSIAFAGDGTGRVPQLSANDGSALKCRQWLGNGAPGNKANDIFFARLPHRRQPHPVLFFGLTRISIDGRELIVRVDIERLQQRL